MAITSTCTIKGDLSRRSLAGSSHHDQEQSSKTELPRLARANSIREILYTTQRNFLRRRESSSRVLSEQEFKEGETQEEHHRMERRNSIQKSMDSFVEENGEDLLKTIIACSNNKPRGHYLRRGSVTKHQIDPKVHEMQPNCRATRSEDEDMRDDNSGANDAADSKRRYLRRGSVTKYVLDAPVDGLQPSKILENSHNLPRRRLPPPPIENSNSQLMTNDEEPVLTEEYDNLPMKPASTKDPKSKTKKDMGNDNSGADDAVDRKRRYLRRGSVTKYVLDAPVDDLQPTNILEDSHLLPRRPLPQPPKKNSNRHLMTDEEEPVLTEEYDKLPMKPASTKDPKSKTKKDMGNDNSGADVAVDRKRRYLRRGSVTKYVLDAPVDDLQPTNILEDSHLLPRRRLPPPPVENSNSQLMANDEEPVLTEERDNLPMKLASTKDPKSKTKKDMGNDNAGADDAADRKRRYLRRGSVTKYVLDAPVEGLQPANILEDSHNPPRRPLPQTPQKENSNRHLVTDEEPVLTEKRDNLPMKPNSTKDRKSETKNNEKTKKQRRSVSFGMVTILEFPLILGHHPSVSAGAPTMLGKECQGIVEVEVRTLEMYFLTHSHRRGRKLALSVNKRAQRLLAAGYSPEQIGAAAQAAQRIKKERVESVGRQKWDRFHIFMESASRSLRTMVDVPPPLPIRARMA
jgi:hypothetical protein